MPNNNEISKEIYSTGDLLRLAWPSSKYESFVDHTNDINAQPHTVHVTLTSLRDAQRVVALQRRN